MAECSRLRGIPSTANDKPRVFSVQISLAINSALYVHKIGPIPLLLIDLPIIEPSLLGVSPFKRSAACTITFFLLVKKEKKSLYILIEKNVTGRALDTGRVLFCIWSRRNSTPSNTHARHKTLTPRLSFLVFFFSAFICYPLCSSVQKYYNASRRLTANYKCRYKCLRTILPAGFPSLVNYRQSMKNWPLIYTSMSLTFTRIKTRKYCTWMTRVFTAVSAKHQRGKVTLITPLFSRALD